jgi:metal-responsive CopG/Arc/MetJ family transcriptional regulator
VENKPKRYVNIKLPEELIQEVDNIIKKGKLGYRSRAEFITEACRDRIMKIKEIYDKD